MKLLKLTAVVFTFTLLLTFVGVAADTWAGFSDVTLKRMSGTTNISTHYKVNDCNQTVWMTSARDDWSSNDRAVQAQLDTSKFWTDLETTKWVAINDEYAHHPGVNYTLYLRAKKSTLSTVSFWGQWSWDKDRTIYN